MNKTTLSFNASEQLLTSAECPKKVASNTVSYIEAVFELGANWSGFDSVRAVWSTRLEKISTVLDSNGKCIVPHELLANTQKVSVNLVGSIAEDDELTDRLTTYPIVALDVDADALVEGTETTEVTPSQFEQFVHTVIDEVAKIKDIESVELNDDYTLTIRFSDDTETTVGPIRGEKGDTGPTGNGIAGIVKTSTTDLVDTYTITYTNGQTTTFNVTNGAKGDTGATGNGIATIAKTSTSGLVDTYTITFTDGTSTTFEVTNGQDGEVTYDELSELLPTETASGDVASFNDGQAVIPAVSVVATITPIQSGSGTPSPSNVRPISGHDEVGVSVVGKNLIDSSNAISGLCAYRAGDTIDTVYASTRYSHSAPIPAEQGLAVSCRTNNFNTFNQVLIECFDSSGKWVRELSISSFEDTTTTKTRTVPSNTYKWVRLAYCSLSGYQVGTDIDGDVMCALGETVMPYTNYNGQSYNTPLGQTVYGGTLDLVSGVLTVTRVSENLDGMQAWSNFAEGTNTARIYFSSPNLSSVMMPNATNTINITTSIGAYAPDYIYSNDVEGISENKNAVANGLWVRVDKTKLSEVSANGVLAYLAQNPIQVVYELATPLTYQLTPQQIDTLLGVNNITATSGQVSVTYKADIQKYIDNAIATFA